MANAKDILNGWGNYFTGGDQTTKEEAKRRAEICATCPASKYGLHTALLPDFTLSEIQGLYCSKEEGGCGCPLSPAVRSKEHQCPKGRW
jgi:hypothetical protein